jgi:transcriptional regulator with XRE-family HTH domain
MGQSASPQPITRAFGARVRRLRQTKGWTLERLGEEAGLHWTYIGSLERGQRNVSLINIVRLAKALDVDPSDLVQGLRSGTTLEEHRQA